MRLTPLDIKKQEFSRTFRGVDGDEVKGFLQMVAEQWEGVLDDRRRLEEKIRDLENKLEHYKKIEEALQEALETARESSQKTIENAQREATLIIKEARSSADEMSQDAVLNRKQLAQEVSQIRNRRDEIVARLRAFLMSEMELLARFEGEDPIGFIRYAAEENRKLRPPKVESADYEAVKEEPRPAPPPPPAAPPPPDPVYDDDLDDTFDEAFDENFDDSFDENFDDSFEEVYEEKAFEEKGYGDKAYGEEMYEATAEDEPDEYATASFAGDEIGDIIADFTGPGERDDENLDGPLTDYEKGLADLEKPAASEDTLPFVPPFPANTAAEPPAARRPPEAPPKFESIPTFEAVPPPPPPPPHPVNVTPEEDVDEDADEPVSVFQAPGRDAAADDDTVRPVHVADDATSDDEPEGRYEGDPYDGLSTDDLEFIKSTVSSVAHDDDEAFLYEPSAEIDDQAWLQDQVASLTPSDDDDEPLFSHDPDGTPFRIESDDDEGDASSRDEATADQARSGAGWIVRPIIAPKQGAGGASPFGKAAMDDDDDDADADDVTASPEEIEKIRRILNDLD